MSRSWECARPSCQKPLPLGVRADSKYCSGACRVATHRAAVTIPAELRSQPRWVRYSKTKVPLTTADRPASSTNPSTWTTYQQAKRSTVGAGLGFVLNGDGIVCIDLDGCIAPSGRITPPALALIELAGQTYIEVSPSGRGLHIWGKAALPAGRCLHWHGQPVELYPSGRYITVTGTRHATAPSQLGSITELVNTVLGAEERWREEVQHHRKSDRERAQQPLAKPR